MNATLYGKPNCQGCTATGRWLDKRGFKAGRDYTYIDMSEDREALAAVQEMGHNQAPVMVLTSKENGAVVDHWSGFRPDRLEQVIA